MGFEIVSREDMGYLAQQSTGNLNIILASMTALMNDTDDKVAMIENQNWFQRMCRTVSGKNRMTQSEIQQNHDKINMYMSQAMKELFEQQCIDHQIIMSLGNQLNGLYAEHLNLKKMLGAFVSKLNEKIESIDNFHMLNTEIEQGVYSNDAPLVAICKIISQLDKRCIQDYRKMSILLRSMEIKGILSDEQVSLVDYLMDIANIPIDDAGTIYIELGGLHGNFIARIIMSLIENYHFLPDIARKLKNKKSIIIDLIASEQLDANVTISINDVYNDFINSKINMINGLIPTSEIKQSEELEEAETLFLNCKLDEAFEKFKILAEVENGRAMYFLGEYYAQGYGSVIIDEDKSKYCCEKGKEKGDILSTLNLAYYFPNDSIERGELFNNTFQDVLSLAKSGDIFAQNEVAYLYASGYGCDKDEDEELKWLIESANNGFWRSMWELGNIYYNKENYAESVKWYKRSADIGFSWAQNNLGNCYYDGEGVDQDYIEAAKWYRKAADQNYNWGQYNLANCYYNGDGVTQSYTEAVKMYLKSAQQGNSEAQNSLGTCYYNGDGINQDYAEAINWYQKAADQNYGWGQYNLAHMYYNGYGVMINYVKAFELYSKAAENGIGDAANMICCMYYNGYSVPRDNNLEFEWAKKSADMGSAAGMNNLGNCYYSGRGTTVNYELAKKWYTEAANRGNSYAEESLKKM